jgi:pilus assembly protein Flp/PilA
MVAKMQALWATREQGATAVEYGLLVALIAAVIVAIVASLGSKILTAFTTVDSKLP